MPVAFTVYNSTILHFGSIFYTCNTSTNRLTSDQEKTVSQEREFRANFLPALGILTILPITYLYLVRNI